ncbi:MFS transporter [Pantoea coffeiphila]|uniref:MFS transporter n=1 Tax=Pantoea coffeiphila TaxID=1465635 RepID=UPI001960DC40|nr:MFS transporter [Pantoea coffeiphila]MBM7345340.1 MFS family permease [Pantoea coffeiphila]
MTDIHPDSIRARTDFPYRALLAPGIAQALIALDYAIVYVALPTLAQRLHLSASEMQWVVSLYGLTFAALLLSGGALCDRLGARRMFIAGMTLFLFASLLGGLAQSGELLLAARAGQGIAAALLQPTVLALMAQRFSGDSHRRALAIWSAIGASGLVAGVILGGALTALSWRAIFFINLPPGLLALWLVRRHFLAAGKQTSLSDLKMGPGLTSSGHSAGKIHRPIFLLLQGSGAVIGCAAAGALVWALMRYAESGAADFLANRLAAATILLFILHERYAPQPLLPRSLRILPGLQTGWLSSACYMASVGSQFFAMTLLWQQSQHLDAVTTGLLFTPLALLIVLGNAFYSRLSVRFAGSCLLIVGFASAGLGLWLLSVNLTDPLSPSFISGIALSGLGHGLIYPAMFAVGLAAVSEPQQGRASALIVTSQYTAGAITLAVIAVLLGTQPEIAAWQEVFRVLSGAALIGMLIAICADRSAGSS